MHCIQLTTVIVNIVQLGISLQDNKGSSRATFVLSHLQCMEVHNHVEYSIYTDVLHIYHMQKEWREDYRGAFRKNVQRCVRRSQDMLQKSILESIIIHNVILTLTHAHTKHLRQHTYLLCVTHYFRYDTCTCMSNVFALLCLISIASTTLHT